MHTLFYLSESLVGAYQTALSPFSRCSRVDDRRVVSGIIYAIKHGLQCRMHLMNTAPTKRVQSLCQVEQDRCFQ